MYTVPSGSIAAHALIFLESMPSERTGLASTVKVRPAAPTMNCRRVIVSMSGLLRRALDRAHDARIRSATADVRAHVLLDLLARRMRIGGKERGRAHDLARLTVAALRHAFREPRALQRIEAPPREPFDGRHLAACDFRHGHETGEHALAVDVHHAGAAQSHAAAEASARELELFAQHPEEPGFGRCLDARRLAVECEVDCHGRFLSEGSRRLL